MSYQSIVTGWRYLLAHCTRLAHRALRLTAWNLGRMVTGATAANCTGLAVARQALLQRQGWDVAAKGIFGTPKIQVVVGE